MKYPQAQSEYLGAITPEGVKRTGTKKVKTGTVRVYEYGFSYAVKALFPSKLAKDIGDGKRAEMIMLHIIQQYSPMSYLLRDVTLPAKDEMHVCLSVHLKKFERLAGVQVEELLPLQHLYLVEIGGQELISEITPEISMLLKKRGITI